LDIAEPKRFLRRTQDKEANKRAEAARDSKNLINKTTRKRKGQKE